MSKTIQITKNVTRKDLKLQESKIPANLLKVSKLSVKRRIQDIRDHFKTSGWDLNYDLIKEDILQQVVPGLSDYIFLSVLKEGHTLTFKDAQIVIRQKKPVPQKKKAKRPSKP